MSAHSAARSYGRAAGAAGAQEVRHAASARAHSELCASLYVCSPYDLAAPAADVPRLSINLLPAPVIGRLRGERPLEAVAPRHSLFLTPAGADAVWRKAAPSRHVNVYFGAELLADAVGADAWSTPRCNVVVPGVRRLVDLLEREVRSDPLFAAEAVDSIARLILLGLARERQNGAPHMLAPRTLRRVAEFVGARLHHRIGVADLARVAGLPPSVFARAFARHCGEPPYRYVLRRRVRAALALLGANHNTTAEIAARCGFSSPQHLAGALRRYAGVSPSEARTRR